MYVSECHGEIQISKGTKLTAKTHLFLKWKAQYTPFRGKPEDLLALKMIRELNSKGFIALLLVFGCFGSLIRFLQAHKNT